jgi:hypothetical protein
MTVTALALTSHAATTRGGNHRRSPSVSLHPLTGPRQPTGQPKERSRNSSKPEPSLASAPAGTVRHPNTSSSSTAPARPLHDDQETSPNFIRRAAKGQLIGPRRGQFSRPLRGPKIVNVGDQYLVPLTGRTGMNKTGSVRASGGERVRGGSKLRLFETLELRKLQASEKTENGTSEFWDFGSGYAK